MTIRLASLLLLACTTSAFAEPTVADATKAAPEPATKDKYVAALYTKGDMQRGGIVEGAHRFGDTAGFLRAKVAVGTIESGFDSIANAPYTSARFEQFMTGLEVRGSGQWVRVFGGFDLGVQLDHRKFMTDDVKMTKLTAHLLTMPRLGVEAGTQVAWVRAAVGVPIWALDDTEMDRREDFVAELGVGVAF